MKPPHLNPVYDDFMHKVFAEKRNRAKYGRELSDRRSSYMEENFRSTWQTWKEHESQFNQTFNSSGFAHNNDIQVDQKRITVKKELTKR